MNTATQRVIEEVRALLTSVLVNPEFTAHEDGGFDVIDDKEITVWVKSFENCANDESVSVELEWLDKDWECHTHDFCQGTKGYDQPYGWAQWLSRELKEMLEKASTEAIRP